MTDEPSRRPRRVLLLGASGLIGSAVLARFAAERIAVRALARRHGAALQRGAALRAVHVDSALALGPMLTIWPIIALNLVALAIVEDR